MYYIDVIALIVSVVTAIFFTVKTLRKTGRRLRTTAIFFMYLGPAVIAVHMIFHTVEISYHAFENILAGTFSYNFRFYSLILFGLILIALNHTLLRTMKSFLSGGSITDVWKSIIPIILVSVPTIPFTPIGALPAIACLISITALPFAKKSKQILSAISLRSITPNKTP